MTIQKLGIAVMDLPDMSARQAEIDLLTLHNARRRVTQALQEYHNEAVNFQDAYADEWTERERARVKTEAKRLASQISLTIERLP